MNRPGFLRPGLLLLLAALCPTVLRARDGAAQPRDGAPRCEPDEPFIHGIAVDAASGAPLPGVYVSVESSDDMSLTTASGRFLLCGIAAGPHAVTAERLGYVEATVDAEARAAPDSVSAAEALAAAARIRIPMAADPIELEGLEIVVDRFERRRRAAASVVRAYDQETLAGSGMWSAADFVASRPGVFTTPCGIERCVYRRGSFVSPSVYLDEFPLPGGWIQLESLPTSQLYLIEVYRRGAHVRAYSHAFMKRAARTRLAPLPIWR